MRMPSLKTIFTLTSLLLSLMISGTGHATLSTSIDAFEKGYFEEAARGFYQIRKSGGVIAVSYLDHMREKQLAEIPDDYRSDLEAIPDELLKTSGHYLKASLICQKFAQSVSGTDLKELCLMVKNYRTHAVIVLEQLINKDLKVATLANKHFHKKERLDPKNPTSSLYKNFLQLEYLYDVEALLKYATVKLDGDFQKSYSCFMQSYKQSPEQAANYAFVVGNLCQSLYKNGADKKKYGKFWYQFAFENGCLQAAQPLAKFALDNDSPEVFRYYVSKILVKDLKDLELGHTYAALMESGKGGFKSPTKARKYYKGLADLGDSDSQYEYGFMCYEGIGGPVDLKEALKYYEMAADKGDMLAQCNFGSMILHGEGGAEKDLVKAFKYLRLSADQGEPVAIYNLAIMTLKGEGGLEPDSKEARRLFTIVANKGDSNAQFEYAVMCHEGEGGPVDFETALINYKRSLVQGNLAARFNYAQMLILGKGCVPDEDEAIIHLKICAGQGDLDAVVILQKLEELKTKRIARLKEQTEARYTKSSINSNQGTNSSLHEEDDKVEEAENVEITLPDLLKEENTTISLKDASSDSIEENSDETTWDKTGAMAKQWQQDRLEKHAQKQQKINSIRQTVILKTSDYQNIEFTPKLGIKVARSNIIVEQETFNFVTAIFSGGIKINTFSQDDSEKAFLNLAKGMGLHCTMKKSDGAVIFTYELKNGRKTRLIYDIPHPKPQLYTALKTYMKRFLISIDVTPERLDIR